MSTMTKQAGAKVRIYGTALFHNATGEVVGTEGVQVLVKMDSNGKTLKFWTTNVLADNGPKPFDGPNTWRNPK